MTRRPKYKFRLFVADHTLNSVQAVANLTAICLAHLPGLYEIEVVDVLKEPKRALADGILMTPTLVRLTPAPSQRIVGTLSQAPLVLYALGLEAAAV